MSEVEYVVHRHVESTFSDSKHAKILTEMREMPGAGDHIFPARANAPNYFETPTGAFRVLEYTGDAWRVRTIFGPEVPSNWHPKDAIYNPRR